MATGGSPSRRATARAIAGLPASSTTHRVSPDYVYTFVHRETHVIVELHYRIRPRSFSFSLAAEQLWGQRVSITVGREEVPSLAPEHLLLFLCAHGANHCWERLAWIC